MVDDKVRRNVRVVAMALSWMSLGLVALLMAFLAVCQQTHLSCWITHIDLQRDGRVESLYFIQANLLGVGVESDERYRSFRLESASRGPTKPGWHLEWWRGTPTHRLSGSGAPEPLREVRGIPWIWRTVREVPPPDYHEDGAKRFSATYLDAYVAVWPLELVLLAAAIPAGRRTWGWLMARMGEVAKWVRRCRREGLCPECGYDLRASKDRCPECGTPIPHQ